MDIDTNARAVIGDNQAPEETPRERFERESRDLQAEVSAWLNEHNGIQSKKDADEAGELIRRAVTLRTRADEARGDDSGPHYSKWKAINKDWNDGPIARAKRCEAELDTPMKLWLKAEKDRIAKEAAEAQRAAEEAQKAAEAQAEKAFEAYDNAQNGMGEGNTLAELEKAEQAKQDAEAAAERAEHLANKKAKARGGAGRSVFLRTETKVVMDMPANFPPGVQAIALGKMLPFIVSALGVNGLDALRAEIGRLAQLAYKKTGDVPPGCKTIEVESIR